MVMMPQPVAAAIENVDPDHTARRIYLSPKGERFRQDKVFTLLNYGHIVLLCGHYEGLDQRVIDLYIDEEISMGDYVLTGGELPAMTLINAVSRYIRRSVGKQRVDRRRKFQQRTFGISSVYSSTRVYGIERSASFARRKP